MASVPTSDGFNLYCEDSGSGTPVVFVHEFAGSCRSFDSQVAEFGKRCRCIAFNARGYPPSDVPAPVDAYSQERAAADIEAVLGAMKIERAHLVGVSMGAAAALQFALAHPARALSATLVGIGTGSDAPEQAQAASESTAALIDAQGLPGLVESMGASPTRRRLRQNNPEAFRGFVSQLEALSAKGMANTMRGVQKRRPPLYAHADALARLAVPVLVVVGEDDAGCRAPSAFLARTLADSQLELVPEAGHAVNIEEPALFNRICLEFIDAVDARRGGGP